MAAYELLGLDLDDDLHDAPEGTVSSLYKVGHATLTIRQHPSAGRQHADGYQHLAPEESASTTLATAPITGGYRSNTPNVGWLVWSSTFVLARHILPMRPTWDDVCVLELVRMAACVRVSHALSGCWGGCARPCHGQAWGARHHDRPPTRDAMDARQRTAQF